MEKSVAILYHGGCPDGFGGAYAAWKKYGDTADYIPVQHQEPPPEHLDDKELYLIDFSYPKETLDALSTSARSLTVLDHHEGVKDVVESLPNHVYDAGRSGATIAWTYFHPDTAVPTMLRYVEDGDLYRFALPDSRSLLAYFYNFPFHFDEWDQLAARAEDPAELAEMARTGALFREHAESIIRELAGRAKLVRFEGYDVYFTPSISMVTSDLANVLARKQGPFALAVQARPNGLRISLRGDGTVNVAELAQKYGGNGHPNASAFSLAWGDPIPWEPIDEDTRD